jgi:hypothetical protein
MTGYSWVVKGLLSPLLRPLSLALSHAGARGLSWRELKGDVGAGFEPARPVSLFCGYRTLRPEKSDIAMSY